VLAMFETWAVSLNRQGSNLPPEIYHTLPIAIPVGSQPLHAVGIAYAEKLKARGRIVLTFMGEGATSQGAVHEAFNLAGVWNVGVVFYVQNNQWAISLPTEKQTATSLGARIAREKSRPVLIEGYTYRLGAHTTADDPKLFRDESQVAGWLEKDPSLEDTFRYTFASLPPVLERQLKRRKSS